MKNQTITLPDNNNIVECFVKPITTNKFMVKLQLVKPYTNIYFKWVGREVYNKVLEDQLNLSFQMKGLTEGF